MRAPSSTPAGMRTDRMRSRRTWPWPWQFVQGSSTSGPTRRSVGQARSTAKKPWVARTRPAPPQVPQTVGLVPGLAPEPSQTSQVMAAGP
jgi:hypothetical protein